MRGLSSKRMVSVWAMVLWRERVKVSSAWVMVMGTGFCNGKIISVPWGVVRELTLRMLLIGGAWVRRVRVSFSPYPCAIIKSEPFSFCACDLSLGALG